MSINDRAAALAPYAEQLLNNRDVQDALQHAAADAGRDSYQRARNTSPRKAVTDKRLQRRLQETAQASFAAWTAVARSPPSASSAHAGVARVLVVTVAAAGAFVALNTDARDTVLGLLPWCFFQFGAMTKGVTRDVQIRGNGETELGDRSIAELLKQLWDQTATLVRQELDLAKAELTVKGKRADVGAGMLGGAGMFGLYALGALTACVILLLSTAMTAWVSRR